MYEPTQLSLYFPFHYAVVGCTVRKFLRMVKQKQKKAGKLFKTYQWNEKLHVY